MACCAQPPSDRSGNLWIFHQYNGRSLREGKPRDRVTSMFTSFSTSFINNNEFRSPLLLTKNPCGVLAFTPDKQKKENNSSALQKKLFDSLASECPTCVGGRGGGRGLLKVLINPSWAASPSTIVAKHPPAPLCR